MRYALLTVALALALAGSALAQEWYSVNDGGFYVKDTPIASTNANSAPGHVDATGAAYSDAGLVYYFNGLLALGELDSVTVGMTGDPIAINLWLDTNNNGSFFAFDGTGLLTGLDGDSYAGHDGVTLSSSTPIFMLGGLGSGGTYTLAQLKSGSVPGIDGHTKVALWVGVTNPGGSPKSADISSVQIQTTQYTVSPEILAIGKPEFSQPHGTGTNPFGFDWDSAAPETRGGAPAGLGHSSFFASVNQSGATQPDRYRALRIGLRDLFGRHITVGEVSKFEYFTKKPAAQTAIDWRPSIYTTVQGTDDISSWYRNRIQSHPSAALNLDAPANVWNLWTTDVGTNQLEFSTNRPGFTSENISWTELVAGPVTRGAYTWDFSGEEIMMIDILLGANSGGGTGESQLDGVRLELDTGEVAILDLSNDPTTLEIIPDKACYKTGEQVTFDIKMSDAPYPVWGGQYFLSFNTDKLSFVEGDPGDAPFTLEMYQFTPAAGELDYATYVALGGTPTAADTVVARIRFQAIEEICNAADLVVFRANDPLTTLTGDQGPVLPLLTVDATAITIDGTAPSITCPADAVLECPADTTPANTGTATATDNCGGTPVIGFSDSVAAGTCPAESIITRTWTATDCAGNTSSCVQTITVQDTTPPVMTAGAILSCYDDEASAELAAIAATSASDACGGVLLTASTFGGGNATIVVTGTDDCGNAASVNYYTHIDGEAPVVVCPASIQVNADAGTSAAVVDPGVTSVTDNSQTLHFEGFEDSGWISNAVHNWSDYNSVIARVNTGTDGIASKTGGAHGVINSTVLPAPPDDYSGAFTRLGGYSSTFCSGFTASVDVFIDLSDPAVAAKTYGFDVSTAASTQAGGHRRDFIFHVAADDNTAPGSVLVGASNNSNFIKRNDLESINNYQISSSGWYTFEWVFRDDGSGVLAVDLNLRDSGGNLLWTETRSAPSDLISTVVGGNRYMWFTFVAADKLAVDNTAVTQAAPVVVGTRDDNQALNAPYPVGTTTITWEATDCCGNTGSCQQTVTVNNTTTAVVDIQLEGADPGVMTRCIQLQFGGSGGAVAPVIRDVAVQFTNGLGQATVADLPAGATWTCVTAKDRKHTLRQQAALSVNGTVYQASFTGTLKLLGGDYTDDNLIDILDFGVLAGQFGQNVGADTLCNHAGRHTDGTGDGIVGSGDFTFIQQKFLDRGEGLCGNAASLASVQPKQSVSLAELARIVGIPAAIKADLNSDRKIDQKDVALFLKGKRGR